MLPRRGPPRPRRCPPWASTRPRTRYRPRPVPLLAPPCQNREKTSSRCSGGDAVAVVGHDQVDRRRVAEHRRPALEAHRAAAVPHGVLDEVGDHLLEPVGVGPQRAEVVGRRRPRTASRSAPAATRRSTWASSRGRSSRGWACTVEPAGVDPGGVEQLGDQPGDPVGVGLDGLEHEALLVVGEPVPVAQQGRGEPLDAGQRRAQLVRHGGEQGGALGLGPPAPLGVAQPHDHGAHLVPGAAAHVLRSDEQLAAAEGSTSSRSRWPVRVCRPCQGSVTSHHDWPSRSCRGRASRMSLTEHVGADDAGDLLGPGVHEPHRRLRPTAAIRPSGMNSSPLTASSSGTLNDCRHVAHATGQAAGRPAGPPRALRPAEA